MPENKKQDWTITIDSFGGFVPAWFENSYPFYGNKNQASDMKNADIIDPNVLKPGPDVINLTNGDETGAVTTLIKGILRTAVANNVTYACGGNKYYQLNSSTVTNTGGTYPHIIDKADVTDEDAEDLVYHKSKIYVFYNHSGNAGDILKDDNGTIDDDWGCYSEDTEVMTIDGWKPIKDVKVGEKVYSLNPITLRVEIAENQETINKSYSGNLIHFKSQGIDLMVTPDHKMLAGFRKYNNKKVYLDYQIVRADSLLNKTNFHLKKNAIWDGKIIDEWEIPEYDNGSKQEIVRDKKGRIVATTGKRFYRPARKFPIKPFLRLLGFYISEGWSTEKMVGISQRIYSKGWQSIKNTLDELGLNYGYYGQSFDIHDKQLAQYIRSIIPNGFFRSGGWTRILRV